MLNAPARLQLVRYILILVSLFGAISLNENAIYYHLENHYVSYQEYLVIQSYKLYGYLFAGFIILLAVYQQRLKLLVISAAALYLISLGLIYFIEADNPHYFWLYSVSTVILLLVIVWRSLSHFIALPIRYKIAVLISVLAAAVIIEHLWPRQYLTLAWSISGVAVCSLIYWLYHQPFQPIAKNFALTLLFKNISTHIITGFVQSFILALIIIDLDLYASYSNAAIQAYFVPLLMIISLLLALILNIWLWHQPLQYVLPIIVLGQLAGLVIVQQYSDLAISKVGIILINVGLWSLLSFNISDLYDKFRAGYLLLALTIYLQSAVLGYLTAYFKLIYSTSHPQQQWMLIYFVLSGLLVYYAALLKQKR